ncbi:unnamed protein product [Closterium sp. Naga37s-1]|nr:unnamed protein product [Closterium sp. Naga37s-1]
MDALTVLFPLLPCFSLLLRCSANCIAPLSPTLPPLLLSSSPPRPIPPSPIPPPCFSTSPLSRFIYSCPLPSSSTHLQFSSSFLCLLHPPFLSSRSLHLLPPLSPTLSIPASAPFHLTRSSRTADLPFVSEPLGPERAHAVVARANATWQLFVDQNVPAEPWAPPAAVLNGSFLESIWKRKYMGDCAPSAAIPVSQPAHLQQQQQAENAAQKAAAEAVSGALVEEKPANGKWGGKLRGIFRTKSDRERQFNSSTRAVIMSTWGAAAVVCCVMYHVREGVVREGVVREGMAAKQRGKEVCERMDLGEMETGENVEEGSKGDGG